MATLHDVAKRANVSPAAASRVLNNDPLFIVSREVRLAIKKAAAELGYRTPRQKKDDGKIIKVGIADWHSLPVSSHSHVSYDNLVPLSQMDISFSFKRLEKGVVENLDAIIAVGIFTEEEIDEMVLSSQNIIFLNNNQGDVPFNRIFIDYDTPVQKCFQYIKDSGYSRVAFINGVSDENGIKIGFRRTEVIKEIMEGKGLYNEDLFFIGELTNESGKEMMKKALEKNPEAIVLGSQLIEEGVMEEYEKLEKKPLIILRRDIDLDYKKTKYPVVRMCSEQLWDVTNLLIYSSLKRPSAPLKIYIQATFELS